MGQTEGPELSGRIVSAGRRHPRWSAAFLVVGGIQAGRHHPGWSAASLVVSGVQAGRRHPLWSAASKLVGGTKTRVGSTKCVE